MNGRNTEIIDVSGYQPLRIPSKKWRERIIKIYEVDGCSSNRSRYVVLKEPV
ncbi:MAG: hypothetical protein GY941_07765 [Planctomycetes bacterium]|nr:hypothetical protein [Planctomycetota bacterium]